MIGDRIKMRRQELGLTQEELAKRMGYKSKSTVNKVETGKNDVNQSTAVKYAEALNTTVAYLMGWETLSDKIMETDPLGKAISKTNPNTHIRKEIIKRKSLDEIYDYLNGELPTYEELELLKDIRRLTAYDREIVNMIAKKSGKEHNS